MDQLVLQGDKEYDVKLTGQELVLLFNLLETQPYNKVSDTIAKMKNQLQAVEEKKENES